MKVDNVARSARCVRAGARVCVQDKTVTVVLKISGATVRTYNFAPRFVHPTTYTRWAR